MKMELNPFVVFLLIKIKRYISNPISIVKSFMNIRNNKGLSIDPWGSSNGAFCVLE